MEQGQITRRGLMAGGIGLGAAVAAGGILGVGTAAAQTPAAPAQASAAAGPGGPARPAGWLRDGAILRTIPRTGEQVPAIGLGTYLTFDLLPGDRRDHLFQVTKEFWEAGGRVVDTSPLYGTGEVSLGHFAATLGIADQLFITNKVWATGEFLADDSVAQRSLDRSLQRLWRSQIDAMQCHSLVNVDVVVPLFAAWKKEGRIRYLGVSHHQLEYYEPLAQWVERGQLDIVQVHYSIHTRQAEERILPAAAERGTAVLVNMPFEKARLFKIVEGRPVPDFARDFAPTWAQFFLKWVISNPAITCAVPATTNPVHLRENMAALTGPLPDQAMRDRMVRHMEGIPGFDTLARMAPYPGKRYPGIIARAQAELRRRGQG